MWRPYSTALGGSSPRCSTSSRSNALPACSRDSSPPRSPPPPPEPRPPPLLTSPPPVPPRPPTDSLASGEGQPLARPWYAEGPRARGGGVRMRPVAAAARSARKCMSQYDYHREYETHALTEAVCDLQLLCACRLRALSRAHCPRACAPTHAPAEALPHL